MKNEPITYQAEKAIQSSYIMPDYIDSVYSVCDNIGLPRPVVKDGRMCKNATFRQGPPIKIVLPKWSRTRLYMLHEIGHYIEYYTYGKQAIASDLKSSLQD